METMKLYEQQILSEAEMERMRLDLSSQVQDRAFARQVAAVPGEEWRRTRNNLKRPRGEVSSYRFRVYVKGLVDKLGMTGGMGVAICDQDDGLVFEISKGLNAKENEGNTELVELKALIEGLHIALAVDLKKIKIVSDNPLLYQYLALERVAFSGSFFNNGLLLKITCHWQKTSKMANVAALANQMHLLLRKICSRHRNEMNITCAICFGKTHVHQMFLLTSCLHRYCYSCMSKHVQFKLHQGVLPKCPHENCKSKLKLDTCKKFLTPELFNIMSQRVKESSIPAEEKIYCPYPWCSTLFSKAELQGSKGNSAGVTKQLGGIECQSAVAFFVSIAKSLGMLIVLL
ncbi:hypothetical protein Sango_0471900 [Sesamum angolense]|uniref:RING-type domain-containing protein n=1 Tax=Sesamum angolense TaxID=2727404 RepID=A0AAE1XBY0_9LAMI|nr:hypothetical protein Sango_0471900 [Sesamum angolense]